MTQDPRRITSVGRLEAAVGKRPPGWHLKSISILDDHCASFLARSPFAVLGLRTPEGRPWSVPIGGDPGVLEVVSRKRVRLGGTPGLVRHVEEAGVGWEHGSLSAGLVALVPGYRETLRVNGRLHGTEIDVEEAFLHCAKCMIRSGLWDPKAEDPASVESAAGVGGVAGAIEIAGTPAAGVGLDHPEVAAFLARSPFITLTSSDAEAHLDVSPKGDPAGFVLRLGPTTLAVPDRPGNRRTDTFHNLLEQPGIALLALVPGDDRVLRLSGHARLTDDPELCARAEVRGNQPSVMLVIEVDQVSLEASQALRSARLWDPARRIGASDLPRASRIWTDHVRLNEDPGVAAHLARAALPERVLRAGLKADYQNNLY